MSFHTNIVNNPAWALSLNATLLKASVYRGTCNSDDGIDAIVKELVGIYEKVGRLEAMKGEEGVRSRCVCIA